MSPKVAFLGLSHLGVVSAAAAAAKGLHVLGVETNDKLAEELRRGEPPVLEPDLPELMQAHRERLDWRSELSALASADLVILSRDVPTDDQGQSDLSPVLALWEAAQPHLKPDAIVLVLVQAPPGFTRRLNYPKNQLFYLVETLIFGRAVERALHPERLILGAADPSAELPKALRAYLDAFECPILPMRYESAELAKISINCCLVASISVANTLSEICEGVGADWSEIAPALKLDARIGQYAYLKPGLGVAGGNLERDLANVVTMADAMGGSASVVAAQIDDSAYRKGWAARRLAALLPKTARIGALGLAYKENTASTKNSPALETIRHLLEGGAHIQAHDPAAADLSALPVCDRFQRVTTPMDAAMEADALAILTPWPAYRALDLEALRKRMRRPLLIDPYAVIAEEAARAAGFDHHVIGRAPKRG